MRSQALHRKSSLYTRGICYASGNTTFIQRLGITDTLQFDAKSGHIVGPVPQKEISKVKREPMYEIWIMIVTCQVLQLSQVPVQNEVFNRFCEPRNLKLHTILLQTPTQKKSNHTTACTAPPLNKNSDIIEEAEILHRCGCKNSDDPFRDQGPFEVTLYTTAPMAVQFRTHVFSTLTLKICATTMLRQGWGNQITMRID